ncbi:hypothetical protein FACS189446_2560 [Bacteroidia bacterium]|nr:hypothetical protein FACS189446_2560 [Bacteroidia bacterium]
MKKIFLIIAMLAPFICAHSQTKSSYLKVIHRTSGSAAIDEIAFNGGEVSILDNMVTIAFASDPSKNKTYAFDKVVSLAFETRTETAIPEVEDKLFNVFLDKNSVLHIQSLQPIGQVHVYSIMGVLVAQTNSVSTVADIDLSSVPQGVYIVQVDTWKVKIRKQ